MALRLVRGTVLHPCGSQDSLQLLFTPSVSLTLAYRYYRCCFTPSTALGLAYRYYRCCSTPSTALRLAYSYYRCYSSPATALRLAYRYYRFHTLCGSQSSLQVLLHTLPLWFVS